MTDLISRSCPACHSNDQPRNACVDLWHVRRAAEATANQRRPRGPLERGHKKLALIRELASEDKTRTQLSKEYGVVTSAISQFAHRHKQEILDCRADFDNKFIGLWIADKGARIAEYQSDVERIDDVIQESGIPNPELIRVKTTSLKAVAEEMGHLPAKTAIQINNQQVISYAVEGIDTDLLR